MPTLKPPHPAAGPDQRYSTLIVRHPYYEMIVSAFMELPALDEDDAVDYNVALIICGIIANNTWSTGWFARSRDGRIVCPPGQPMAVASGDVYYFATKDPTYKYPICISWADWNLPETEADLPSAFKALRILESPEMSGGGWLADVKARDKTCRASGVMDCCKYTTVIPESENDWWNSNRSEYSPVVWSHENGILLRADLRESFEAGAWVPMPTEDGKVMLYVVQPSLLSSQFVQLWHAREMQPLIGVNRYLLFIRVAYAILCLQCDYLGFRHFAISSEDYLSVCMKNGKQKAMNPMDLKKYIASNRSYLAKGANYSSKSMRRQFIYPRSKPELPLAFKDWGAQITKYSLPDFHKKPPPEQCIGVFCHRGYYDRAMNIPENSLFSIMHGINEGLFLHEVDVWTTSKDRITSFFLAHDKSARRTTALDRNWSSINFEEADLVEKRFDVDKGTHGDFASSYSKRIEKVPTVDDLMTPNSLPGCDNCTFQLDLRGVEAFTKGISLFSGYLPGGIRVFLKGYNTDFPTFDTLYEKLIREYIWFKPNPNGWIGNRVAQIIMVFCREPFIKAAVEASGLDPDQVTPQVLWEKVTYKTIRRIVAKQITRFITMQSKYHYKLVVELAHSGLGLGYDVAKKVVHSPLDGQPIDDEEVKFLSRVDRVMIDVSLELRGSYPNLFFASCTRLCDLRIPDGEGTELIADWQTGKFKKPEGLEWEITSKLRGIHGGLYPQSHIVVADHPLAEIAARTWIDEYAKLDRSLLLKRPKHTWFPYNDWLKRAGKDIQEAIAKLNGPFLQNTLEGDRRKTTFERVFEK